MRFSSGVREINHNMNGLLSLSIDQSLLLKSVGFSTRKRESKAGVACKCLGDNLLCSAKNFCLAVILIHCSTLFHLPQDLSQLFQLLTLKQKEG